MSDDTVAEQREIHRPGYDPAIDKYELEECVFNWASYLRKRLPIDYPAGGIAAWLRYGLTVTLWHGRDDRPPIERDEHHLHSIIEHRGSNRHLEYKLYVYIAKDGRIQADFRGILGVFRMRKLQALLLLAGVPAGSIQRQHEADGDLSSLVEQDLRDLADCRVAVVGGLSDMAREEMSLL